MRALAGLALLLGVASQDVEATTAGFRREMWRTGVHHRSLGDTDVGVRVLPGGDCTKHPGEGCETTGSLCSSAAFDTLSLDRLVVVAGTRHDPSWLDDVGLKYIQYQSESPHEPHYFRNLANEGSAYLQFIHDYYDCLPKAVAFLHGHSTSWHSANMTMSMAGLRWERLQGYHDLNRVMDLWSTNLLDLQPVPYADPVAEGGDVYNGSFVRGQIVAGKAYPYWEAYLWHQWKAGQQFYDDMLGPAGFGPMPDRVEFYCCSQFAVTKERIQASPRQFYTNVLMYLHKTQIQGNHHADKVFTLGDVFTSFWALIFGEAAVLKRGISDCELFDTPDCNHVSQE